MFELLNILYSTPYTFSGGWLIVDFLKDPQELQSITITVINISLNFIVLFFTPHKHYMLGVLERIVERHLNYTGSIVI